MSRSGEAGGGGRVRGSHWWRFALQQVLMDVFGIPLEPGSVQENVLAALLHGALGRGRVVSLEETLRTHTIARAEMRVCVTQMINQLTSIVYSHVMTDENDIFYYRNTTLWLTFTSAAILSIANPSTVSWTREMYQKKIKKFPLIC